jgi:hypothetical protein
MNRIEQVKKHIQNVNEMKKALKKGYAKCNDCNKNIVLGQYHLHKRSDECK